MKKFGMMLLALSLFSFTVGCGGAEDAVKDTADMATDAVDATADAATDAMGDDDGEGSDDHDHAAE